MKWENTGWLVTCDCPLRNDSVIQLTSEFKDGVSMFDQSSQQNCIERRPLKLVHFFHLIETSHELHEVLDFVPLLNIKKLLISSKLFVSCKSTINLTSLRLDNSIQFLDSSSVTIGLELMFLNLCSTTGENLLFSSFPKNPDALIF